MARFNVKVPEWCCLSVAPQVETSRPFRMMRPGDDGSAGPGCYESSRELERGLQVMEAGLEDWQAARARGPVPALRAPRDPVNATA